MTMEYSSPSTSFTPLKSELEDDSNPTMLNILSKSFNSSLPAIVSDGKFFQVIPEKCTLTQTIGACVKCRPGLVEIKGHGSSSSNFLSHLKRKHGQEAVEEYYNWLNENRESGGIIKKMKIIKNNNLQKVFLNNSPKVGISQDDFENNILKFIMHSMLPLRIVEDPFFIKMFEDLVPQCGVKLMSCRSLCRNMEKLFERNVKCLKEIFSNLRYVCTTVDVWPSRQRGFLGVTAHWIKEDTMERCSAALAYRRFCKSKNQKRISECITEINNEYGLSPFKVIATVTDNVSNIIRGLKEYGVKENCIELVRKFNDCESKITEIKNKSDSEEEVQTCSSATSTFGDLQLVLPRHIKCFAYTLNLCAAVDVPKAISSCESLKLIHRQVIDKCNLLWHAASYSKSAKVMQDILGYSLTRPCETRWNSFYDALTKVLLMRDKSAQVFQALKIDASISEDEFEYIREHLDCAAPIANALDILQGEKYTYYGAVVAVLFTLIPKLENLCSKQWKYCDIIAQCFLNSVLYRFKDIYSFSTTESINAAIAALSHPEFKNRWLGTVPLEYQLVLMDSFKTAVSLESTSQEDYIQGNTSSTSKLDDFFDFGEKDAVNHSPDQQIFNFFKDSRRSIKMLDFYPRVKQVFLKFNTPLTSSVTSERLSSYAAMADLPKSNKLTDKTFEMRVIMKTNSHLFDK